SRGTLHANKVPEGGHERHAPERGPVAAPHFPADATLTQVLGFRAAPGLEAPFVFPTHNYLGVGTHLRLLDSTPAFGRAGPFCRAHCKLDLQRWGKGVSSTCSFPAGMGGSIPPGSPLLKPLPPMKFVKGSSEVRATDEVLAGLKRADDYIAGFAAWPQGHVVFVRNCYRSDVLDSTNE